jgi:hypothetical protein
MTTAELEARKFERVSRRREGLVIGVERTWLARARSNDIDPKPTPLRREYAASTEERPAYSENPPCAGPLRPCSGMRLWAIRYDCRFACLRWQCRGPGQISLDRNGVPSAELGWSPALLAEMQEKSARLHLTAVMVIHHRTVVAQ